MSSDLCDQIRLELENLRIMLFERHPGLLDKASHEAPTALELDALAVMLHGFYSGVENVFKRIAQVHDGAIPQGELWHARLLDTMSQPGPGRPAVISESLRQRLRQYMDFRHVFRHAYSFQLQWQKMAGLVRELSGTFSMFQGELDLFMRSICQEP